MKLKNFLMVLFLLSFGILLVACNSTEVRITVEADFDITVGDKVTLNADVVGLDKFELVYTSEDPAVASVTDAGVITALKAGNTKITIGIKDNEEVKTEFPIIVKHKVALNDFAPTAIVITGDAEVALNTTGKLNAALTPATANQGLVWESEDSDIVAVLGDGTVLARGYGSVKITAKSTINNAIKGEFTVTVIAEGTEQEVADSAVAFLLAQLPQYVSESFTYPTHPNPGVQVEWKNSMNQVKTEYDFAATRDESDTVTLKVNYGDAEVSQVVTLKLVVNLEDNLHAKLPYAVASVKAYMAAVGTNITDDLLLYTNIDGVKLTWTSNKATVIKANGEFIRPHNDTPVKLTANFGHTGASAMLVFDVVAKGYTQAEKVNFMLNEGTLKPFVDFSTNSNVSLPTVDEKFGATLTWVSGTPTVANNDGSYANIDLAEETVVTFTVTIKYEVTGFAFEQTVEIDITYKPLNAVGKAVLAFLNGTYELPKQVVFGASPQFMDQLIGMPTDLVGHDGVTISWSGKEGEFDQDMKVLVPRFSYTPTEVYATFSKEGLDDAVLALPINIGIMTGSADEFAFNPRTPGYTVGQDQKLGMPAVEGGIGTAYALGFEAFYFKSTFERLVGEEKVTKTWYHFFAPGNVKVYGAEHLMTVGDKKFVDKAATGAALAPQWTSTTRFFKNGTDGMIYVNKDDVVVLGAQAGSAAYTPFVVDKDGYVTTVSTPAMAFSPEGFTEYPIPAGGMLVLPGYLESGVNPNLGTFGTELGRKIDVLPLTGWTTYTVPKPAA